MDPSQRKPRRVWVARRQPLHPSISQLLILRLFSMRNAIQSLLRRQERGLQDIQDALERRDADGVTDNVQADSYHMYRCNIDFLQICASGRNFVIVQNPADTAPYTIQQDSGSSTPNNQRRATRRSTPGSRRRPLYASGIQLVLVRLIVFIQNLMKKQDQLLATIQDILRVQGGGNVEQLYNLHRCRVQTLQICGSGENSITVQGRREIFVIYDEEGYYDDYEEPYCDDQDYDDQFQVYDDQDPYYGDQDPSYDDQNPYDDDQSYENQAYYDDYDYQDYDQDYQDYIQDYHDYDQDYQDQYCDDYDTYYDDDSAECTFESLSVAFSPSSCAPLPGLFDTSDAEQEETVDVDLTGGSPGLTDSVSRNARSTAHDSGHQGILESTALPRLLCICWTADSATALSGPLETANLFSNGGAGTQSANPEFSDSTPPADLECLEITETASPDIQHVTESATQETLQTIEFANPVFPVVTESALTSGLAKVTESAVCLTEGQAELGERAFNPLAHSATETLISTSDCMPKEVKPSSSSLWLYKMSWLTCQLLLTLTFSGWLVRLFLCSDSQMKPLGIAQQFLFYGLVTLVTLVLPQIPSGRKGMVMAREIVAMLRQVPSVSMFCRWVALLAMTGFSLGVSPLPVYLVLVTIQVTVYI